MSHEKLMDGELCVEGHTPPSLRDLWIEALRHHTVTSTHAFGDNILIK